MRKTPHDESKPLIRATDKLLILGTASTKDQAPIGDPSFTTWAVSPYASYPGVVTDKVDVMFEMHPQRYWGNDDITQRLMGFRGPVVMQEAFPEIPNAVRYPFEDVYSQFMIPAMGSDLYVTNTVSYMVMLGYLMGYEEFHLYGVHMSHNTEYGYQKPNCEYYLGYIAGQGKVVVIPKGGELLKAPYLYGYNEPWQDISALRGDSEKFDQQVLECDNEIEELKKKRWIAEGMKQYAKMIAHAKGAF